MGGRRTSRLQQGAALLIFMILVVTAALTYVVSSLTPEAIEARRAQKTQEVLSLAREALLGYALVYREQQITQGQYDRVYGYLPLPDLGSSRNNNAACTQEGCDAANFSGNALNTTVIGRLPWRTLGIGPLRDGSGECLWYVVSGSHQRQQRVTPMSWDSLGHLDVVVANGTGALASALAGAHDRPVAIIFSPGSPLPGQDRSNSAGDDVGQCGGNYDAANYLDPTSAIAGITNYLSGTNSATAVTGDSNPANDPDTPKGMLVQGKIFAAGGNYLPNACTGGNCSLVVNDAGLTLSSDQLFDTLRKSANFRLDLNTLLERMTSCLRDQIAGGSPPAAYAKVADSPTGCYGDAADPIGYYSNYRDMIFVAAPGSSSVTVDGAAQPSCSGALIFAGQRRAGQQRITPADKAAYANYLEGGNLTSFVASGNSFAGAGTFARTSSAGQEKNQDIVRCIPTGPSFASVESPTLTALGIGQLTQYAPASGTLTLGRSGAESDLGVPGHALFGCAWRPEAAATGSGLHAYFRFYIYNTGWPGDGFALAMADGDANGASACGAAAQHLGYSGNNNRIPPLPIVPPKIGVEFDTKRNHRTDVAFTDPTGFDPSYLGSTPASLSSLDNGRADPNYHDAGHIGVVYWGGETAISTGLGCGFGCTYPQYCSGGVCYLNTEEDDNVHGRSPSAAVAARPPPANPVAPAIMAAAPTGVYELTPDSSIADGVWIHVRIELDRDHPADAYNSRPVLVVAVDNRTLAGLQTIDGVALQEGDRVLLTAQTAGKENGVWVATAGSWARASTEDEIADMPSGTAWIVRAGTANAWTYWQLTNPAGYQLARIPSDSGSALAIAKVTPPWKAVATSAITLSAPQTIDGTAVVADDQVLVTAQASPGDNGIYTVKAGAWQRVPMYRGSYTTRAWVLKQNLANASRIDRMKLISRSMADLEFGLGVTPTSHLLDTANIYSPQNGACTGNAQCPSGQWCGIDNICYRPAFRTLRLGFTNGQGTRDQLIDIKDFAVTWLP